MNFGNLRETSVNIGNNKKTCMPSGKRRLHSVSGRANGMHPEFFGKHTTLFIISDLYRVLTEIAEVHTDIERSVLKSIILLLP